MLRPQRFQLLGRKVLQNNQAKETLPSKRGPAKTPSALRANHRNPKAPRHRTPPRNLSKGSGSSGRKAASSGEVTKRSAMALTLPTRNLKLCLCENASNGRARRKQQPSNIIHTQISISMYLRYMCAIFEPYTNKKHIHHKLSPSHAQSGGS